MTDRTSYHLGIHKCPDEQLPAVLEFLNAEFGGWDDELDLSEVVEITDVTRDFAVDKAAGLAAAAPEASFVLWEEPCYEGIGTLCAYRPGLGMFTAPCDAAGEVHVPAGDLTAMIALMAEADPDDYDGTLFDAVRDRIRLMTGGAWLDEVHARYADAEHGTWPAS